MGIETAALIAAAAGTVGSTALSLKNTADAREAIKKQERDARQAKAEAESRDRDNKARKDAVAARKAGLMRQNRGRAMAAPKGGTLLTGGATGQSTLLTGNRMIGGGRQNIGG